MTRSHRFPLALLSACLLSAFAAPAASGSPRSDVEQALAQARAIFGANGATALSATAGPSGHEATPILLRLSRNLDALPPAERRAARKLLERPSQLSDRDNFGPEAAASPICDAHLCVHWGTKRGAAPMGDNSDSNGIPDYAEATLAAGTTTWDVENGDLGWKRPPSDGKTGARNGIGGQGQTDVYITDLPSNLYGYSTTDPGSRGVRAPGYVVVDNDYDGFGGVPVQLMRVTLAHEYNHVLQFGYDSYEDSWMFESTATFMENRVFPNVDDYLNYLPQFARTSALPLAQPNRGYNLKVYGSAVWNHYLAGVYGPDVVRKAWALSTQVKPSHFAVAAYDKSIKGHGGQGLAQSFVDFAAASAEWRSSTLFPDKYPDMERAGTLGRSAQSVELDHTAYRLFDVKPRGGNLTLSVSGGTGTQTGIGLVGHTGTSTGGTTGLSVRYLDKGGRSSVELPDAGKYDRITAVIVNADGRVRGNTRNYTHDGVDYRIVLG